MYRAFSPQCSVLKHWIKVRRCVTTTQPPLEFFLRNCKIIGWYVEEIETKVLGPRKGFDATTQFIVEPCTKQNVYISICHGV